jgi:hypothetical protein
VKRKKIKEYYKLKPYISYELKTNNFPSPTTPLTPLKGRTGLTRNSSQIKKYKWYNIKGIARWGYPFQGVRG